MIYVVPGNGQRLRPGNYVDLDRRCYHPTLAYWVDDIRTSYLRKTVEALQRAFHEEPPIVDDIDDRPPIPGKVVTERPASSEQIPARPVSQDRPVRPPKPESGAPKQRPELPQPAVQATSVNTTRDKVVRLLDDIAQSHAQRHDALHAQITSNTTKVDRDISILTRQINDLKSIRLHAHRNHDLLTTKIKSIDDLLPQLMPDPYTPISQSVVAQNVLFNQFLTLHIKEQALDDAIYALSQSLDAGLKFDDFARVRMIETELIVRSPEDYPGTNS